MRFFALCVMLLATLFLSACATEKNKYIKGSKEVNGLIVPADVPAINQQPYYPIPPMPANAPTGKLVSVIPPTLQSK